MATATEVANRGRCFDPSTAGGGLFAAVYCQIQ